MPSDRAGLSDADFLDDLRYRAERLGETSCVNVERLRLLEIIADYERMPTYAQGYEDGAKPYRAAILDIDAHASPLCSDGDGFVDGGYIVTVGALHRALGVVGHTAVKCPACRPRSHDCEATYAD